MSETTTEQRPEPGRWEWRPWQWWLLLVGFILRLIAAYWISQSDPYSGWDGREYHAFAKSLAAFAGDDYPRFFNFIRAPGYPAFLVPFVWIGGDAIWPVQLFQCVLGLVEAWVLAEIVRRWAGKRAGNWMLVIATLHPFLIYYCGFILTETVFTTLMWAGILALQQLTPGRRRDVWRWTVWSGLAFGLASLARPATQPFLPVAVVWLGWQARRMDGWRACMKQMGVFTAVASAVLLPWQLGNLWVHQEFTLGPKYGKAVYLQSNSMDFLRMYDAHTADEYYRAFTDSVYSLSLKDGTDPDTWMKEAAKFRAEHPSEWWRMQRLKVVHFWRPWLNPVIFPRPIFLLSIVSTTPFFLLAALELWKRRRQWEPFLGLLACVVVSGYVIGGLLFVASVRYRIPLVDVTFMMLSASWLAGRFPGRTAAPAA